MNFQTFYFIWCCKWIVPLLGCIRIMLHNRCKDRSVKDFVPSIFQTFYRHTVDKYTKKITFYIIHIVYWCHWSIITTLNENCRGKFNLFWILRLLDIVTPRQALQFVIQTLQFVINSKVFIKFHLASHFGLYIKKKLKFPKFFFAVLLI